jgi:F-type H+-transporting ATPase subunit b
MLIDWFTVAAQLVNFFILVWLLKRFLYKPILDAIDARERRIASSLADAATNQKRAEEEREAFQAKNEELDQRRDQLLGKAREEAEAEAGRLLDEARQAAFALRAKRQDALAREQVRLNDEITRRTREEVFAIARKTLMDLAGTSLEERISEAFTQRLRGLDAQAREGLAKALKAPSQPVLVRSAFDLPAEQRASIRQALRETVSADIPVRFEAGPDVIGGIELSANGWKVGWSIAAYLGSLEKAVGDRLNQEAAPGADPESRGERPPAAPEARK